MPLSPAVAGPPPPLRRNRPLQGFLAGLLVSRLGDQIYGLALPWLVYNLTGSALVMGGVFAAAQLPVLLSPLVGSLVDRWDRRRILLAAAVARAALVGAVPLLWQTGALALWHLLALGFALGLCTQLADLALFAITPLAVPEPDIPAINGLLDTTLAAAQVAGPALGGVLIALTGAPAALLVSGVSFLVIVPPLLWFRPAPLAPQPRGAGVAGFLSDTWSGLRYVLTHRILLPLGLALMVLNIGVSGAFALLLYFVRHDLDLSPTIAGVVLGAGGVAAVFGALSTPLLQRRLRLPVIITLSIAGGSVALLGAAVARSVAALTAISVLWGATSMMVSPVTRTLRHRIVPPGLLGRVQAGSTLIAWWANPLASLAGGAAAQAWGSRPVFAVGGAIVLTAAAFIWLTPVRRA